MKYHIYISFYFCFLLANTSFAQSPYYQQITNQDGLPSMTIYDILEDQKGYIWIATNAGVCRYDGVRFETIEVPQDQGKSFSYLQENSHGRMYFSNFNGQLFYIYQQKAYEVSLPPAVKKNGFINFFIDHNDGIWLSTQNARVYFKKQESDVWQYLVLAEEKPFFSRNFVQDAQHNVWLLSNAHFYQFDFEPKIKQNIINPGHFLQATFLGQEVIFNTTQQNVFYNYNVGSKQWKKILKNTQLSKLGAFTRSSNIDKQNNVWICSNQGALLYSSDYEPLANNSIFLKDIFIGKIIQDRENNYWFATVGNGLFKMFNKDIVHFDKHNSNLTSNQLNCLAQDKQGNLYIGANSKTLFYLDTKKQRVIPKFRLIYDDVECMLFDSTQNRLYVENNSLRIFDTKNAEKSGIIGTGYTPKAISKYKEKYLVVATGQGAYMVTTNKQDSLPEAYRNTFEAEYDGVILRRKRSRTIHAETSQQRFWVGYTDGLYYYENAKAYEFKTQNGQSIIALDIIEDTSGVLWVGTAQQGVFVIDNKQIVWHLDHTQGLISNLCRKVFKQGNDLYLATDKGLHVYDLITKKSRVFNQEDGLPSNEIRDLTVIKDQIYLATAAGLSIVSKDFSTVNRVPPLVYITGLKLKNIAQKLLPEYSFDYNENNLSVYFAGIALRSGGRFRYKYRMKGLEKRWSYSNSSSNFARYFALPPGEYAFEVKAINEDGIESLETATIKIKIALPVWKEWWFIVLMVLLGLAVVSGVFFYRIRAIKRKNEVEKALSKAALESLKLQMNPHFIFNAMGAIQHYMIQNDAKRAGNYLARFSTLMRAILEHSRSEYISLDEEVEMLEHYLTLQNLRHEDNFEYQVNVDEQLDPYEVAIPPMFAQPFIENAIEHGIAGLKGTGLILINFSMQNDVILLEIRDNGVGIDRSLEAKKSKSSTHRSLATQITKERIALYEQSMKKNILFEVNPLDKGTQVIFHLPYQLL